MIIKDQVDPLYKFFFAQLPILYHRKWTLDNGGRKTENMLNNTETV